MANLEQIEENIKASFGYVKKDLLKLNDSIADIYNKIQHLSLNHANLMQKIEKLEEKTKKKTSKTKKRSSRK